MKPVRIQRKRTKGWKMPPNTVYVGRPTKWGNPFPGFYERRSVAVSRYRDWLPDSIQADAMIELRGKNLACWCPLKDRHGFTVPCHADILLEIANA